MKHAIVLAVIIAGLIGGYLVYNHTENERVELEYRLSKERKDAAIELEKKRAEEERSRNASLVKMYARKAGEKLLAKVAPSLGGQDLLVEVTS